MTIKRLHLLLDADSAERLKAIKARLGLSEAAQLRAGLKLWFESRGACRKRTHDRRPELPHDSLASYLEAMALPVDEL